MSVYAGIFLTALATLVYEVTLLRILSVMSWYHLAFFAISTAMLGLTAGAVTVYLGKRAFSKDNLRKSYVAAAMAFGISIPVSLTLLCFTPIAFQHTVASFARILLAALERVIPFYFSGIVITAVLTREDKPVGKLYAADLTGAAFGCLVVIFGLERLSAPDLILLAGPLAASAAFVLATGRGRCPLRPWAAVTLVGLILVFLGNAVSGGFISPRTIKGHRLDTRKFPYQKWNSFSWVNVAAEFFKPPPLWGPSPIAPRTNVKYFLLAIDGEAGTTMISLEDPAALEVLKYDMVNLAHYIRRGSTCVIGVGGGRDLASAIAFGDRRVLGVEVNPLFINDLLQRRYREFAGLAGRPGVDLVADEARSYLARSRAKFDIIIMSLADTWAATGAGAYTLSENGLYTVEAWKVFLSRLKEGGILTVSRWFSPDQPGETARLVSLAATALFEIGVAEPAKHVVLTTVGSVATILVSNRPFSAEDLNALTATADRLKFNIVILPGQVPDNEWLRSIMTAGSAKAIDDSVRQAPLNYRAPRDETPFFFNMVKLNNLSFAWRRSAGGLAGNMIANITLIILIGALAVIALAVIVIPLLVGAGKGESRVDLAPAAYFSLTGAGFMLVQIGLVQKLSVFLGRPTYALGILLFTMILSAGLGSLASERLDLNKAPWPVLVPVIIGACLFALIFVSRAVMAALTPASLEAKIAASMAMIAPPAFFMGMCFPVGMRLISGTTKAGTPWYWALNGIFGVLSSATAVLISIYSGISTNLWLGAVFYLALLPFIPRMKKLKSPELA